MAKSKQNITQISDTSTDKYRTWWDILMDDVYRRQGAIINHNNSLIGLYLLQ